MTKKLKEISSMGEEELRRKLIELKKELVKLNAQVATGTAPKNPSGIRNTRRMMARILMLLNRMEMEKKISDSISKEKTKASPKTSKTQSKSQKEKTDKTPKKSEEKKA